MHLFIFFILCFTSPLICKEAEPAYDFRGNHLIASFLKCDAEAIYDSKKIVQIMKEAVNKTGAQILSESHHFFEPQGLTQVLLLSESHASIHTYPDLGSCFVDLFTCGDHCHWEPYFEDLKNYFKAEEVSILLLERGSGVIISEPMQPD